MDATALTISIIGAINWGLIGFFNFNLAIQDHLRHCRNLRNLSVEFLHQNRKRIVDPG